MTTLREILESGDGNVFSEDIISMAEKLGVKLKLTEGTSRRMIHANSMKVQIIVTQFQIQFGLDEEF